MTYSDVNPPAEPTKAETVRAITTRVTYRYGQSITLIVGILLGYVLAKL